MAIDHDWTEDHRVEMGRKERAKKKWQRWSKKDVSAFWRALCLYASFHDSSATSWPLQIRSNDTIDSTSSHCQRYKVCYEVDLVRYVFLRAKEPRAKVYPSSVACVTTVSQIVGQTDLIQASTRKRAFCVTANRLIRVSRYRNQRIIRPGKYFRLGVSCLFGGGITGSSFVSRPDTTLHNYYAKGHDKIEAWLESGSSSSAEHKLRATRDCVNF